MLHYYISITVIVMIHIALGLRKKVYNQIITVFGEAKILFSISGNGSTEYKQIL